MAVEPDPFAVYMLNGKPAGEILPDAHFIDRSIRVLELDPAALRHGANCFEVKTQFVQRPEIRETLERAKCFEGESNKLFFDSEVEAVYLLGEFGCFNCGKVQLQAPCCKLLSGPFEIGSVPESLSAGDLTGSGYPFFSGTFSLEKNFILTAEQARKLSTLTFTPFRANSVEAELNGVRLAPVWSAPYRLDVSGMLREGENHLRLHITTSCRNTLGPLHTRTVEPMAVGPFSFLMERSAINFDPPPVTPDYGIIEPGPQQILLT